MLYGEHVGIEISKPLLPVLRKLQIANCVFDIWLNCIPVESRVLIGEVCSTVDAKNLIGPSLNELVIEVR